MDRRSPSARAATPTSTASDRAASRIPPRRAAASPSAAVPARLRAASRCSLVSPAIRVPDTASQVDTGVCTAAGLDMKPARIRCTAIPAGDDSTPATSAGRPPAAVRRNVPSSALSRAGHCAAASSSACPGRASTVATSARSRWAASTACTMAR